MGSIFHLQENKTTAATEIIAGTTTFLASMYIIVVNPDILSQAGLPFSGVLTATVLVSAFSSIMMGLYANNPIVLAPGMGLNVFFTFSVIIGMKVPWPTALGAVFWSGVVFLLLSVFSYPYLYNAGYSQTDPLWRGCRDWIIYYIYRTDTLGIYYQ